MTVIERGPLKFELRDSPRGLHESDRAAFSQVVLLGEYELILKNLDKGDIVVDCGANIGCFTLLAASLVGPQGSVIAVEPHPGNIAQLRRNVALNHLDNVSIVGCALGAVDGKEVGLAGEGVTCTLDVAAGPAATTSTTVTLGTLMAQFGPKPARALKIDVEGSETEMFRRQSDIDVLRNAKFVVAEVHSELAYN